MRKYYIYLRGQVKPLVITETKDEKNTDAIKRISNFILGNASVFTLLTDNDLIICRPSDISSVHVVDKTGFSEEEIELSKEERLVKEELFDKITPELFDKCKPELKDSPKSNVVVPEKLVPALEIPTLNKPSRDKILQNSNDFPIIASNVVPRERV